MKVIFIPNYPYYSNWHYMWNDVVHGLRVQTACGAWATYDPVNMTILAPSEIKNHEKICKLCRNTVSKQAKKILF